MPPRRPGWDDARSPQGARWLVTVEFQRLTSVRARHRSRRRRWARATSALGIAAAIVLLSWRGASTLPGSRRPGLGHVASSPRWAAWLRSDHGEAHGSVDTVEPETGIVRVSSGFLGLMSVALLVTPETVIVVGDKEGGLGDLRQGGRVVAAYEVRSGALEARRIELFPLARAPEN
jgi:hypothetical protein